LSLSGETDHDVMMMKARKLKEHKINITVVQTGSDSNKENESGIEELSQDTTKKKVVHDT
jgi:hypothetical protein